MAIMAARTNIGDAFFAVLIIDLRLIMAGEAAVRRASRRVALAALPVCISVIHREAVLE
jgi:hypothetical protein